MTGSTCSQVVDPNARAREEKRLMYVRRMIMLTLTLTIVPVFCNLLMRILSPFLFVCNVNSFPRRCETMHFHFHFHG